MSDYTTHFALETLLFVVRMAAQGDIKGPKRLGIRDHQISRLLDLSTQEIHDIARMSQANYLQFQFDPDALEIVLDLNTFKTERRQQMIKLLMAGASHPVMNHLYGMTTDDMVVYRRMLGLNHTEGRPSLATDSEQQQIWSILTPIDELDNERLPERLLKAHEETGVKINTIWGLLNQWWDVETASAIKYG